MVYRVFVEKKPGLSPECGTLLNDCRAFLGLTGVEKVRIWNRYDAEGLDEELFERAKRVVFSEPPLDVVSDAPETDGAAAVFAVEPLPGQFDQRADRMYLHAAELTFRHPVTGETMHFLSPSGF